MCKSSILKITYSLTYKSMHKCLCVWVKFSKNYTEAITPEGRACLKGLGISSDLTSVHPSALTATCYENWGLLDVVSRYLMPSQLSIRPCVLTEYFEIEAWKWPLNVDQQLPMCIWHVCWPKLKCRTQIIWVDI